MSIPHEESEGGHSHSDLHPAVHEVVEKEALVVRQTHVGLLTDEANQPFIPDQHAVHLTDGKKTAV